MQNTIYNSTGSVTIKNVNTHLSTLYTIARCRRYSWIKLGLVRRSRISLKPSFMSVLDSCRTRHKWRNHSTEWSMHQWRPDQLTSFSNDQKCDNIRQYTADVPLDTRLVSSKRDLSRLLRENPLFFLSSSLFWKGHRLELVASRQVHFHFKILIMHTLGTNYLCLLPIIGMSCNPLPCTIIIPW